VADIRSDETRRRAESELAYHEVGDLDIRLGGGPTTINEFLQADLVDYLHIVLIPVVLGRGVRLWGGLEGLHERYTVETVTVPSGATHVFFTR
jgi:riboflavin biosynthesis pyrimidine reductase